MCHEPSSSAEIKTIADSVACGDHRTLESLFAAHRPYLRQVIGLRMDDAIRGRVDPSDIVQEAHLEALRRVEDYVHNPQLPPRLWMRQIAIDRLIMAYRQHLNADKRTVLRECVIPEQSSIGLARRLVSEIPSPITAAASHEVAGLVREAVAQLNETDREVVMLQAFEGLTSSESAQLLGIRPEAVRKRFGRALLRLQQHLVERGLGESRV